MSTIKEPNYFLFGASGEPSIAEAPIVRKSVRRLGDYTALFRPAPGHRAIGDASPLYLSTGEAARRIAALCGLIPIIAMIRQPADRAWSHFLYAVPTSSHDEATERFAELVRAEMDGRAGDGPYRTSTHLVRLGLYGEQIDRYQQVFGHERVHVVLTADLARKPNRTLASLTRAIGVDHLPGLPFEQVNESGAAPGGAAGLANRAIRTVQPTLKAVLPPRVAGALARKRIDLTSRIAQPMPPLDAGLRREITSWCADDVVTLGRLIDRDLSEWLGPKQSAARVPA